jgi:WD40 repeat protein
MASGSRDYGQFDELAEEFAARYRRGEQPSLEEYVDRLPEMADEIRAMFPALVAVEQVDGDARDEALKRKAPALLALRELGDYRIVREIGRGGMGVVYEAEQISLGRRVALKVLPRQVVGDRKALERFRHEAKAAARLHHTNIVPVFEVGQEGDVAFYAMQFIQGQGLDQVIDELRRLGRHVRKSVGSNQAALEGSAHSAIAIPSGEAAAAGPLSRKLGQLAESLRSGRFGSGGLASTAGAASVTTEATGAKPVDLVSTMHAESPPAGRYAGERPPPAEVSNSAVLPGGTAVSMVDSAGRRLPYFRSVAQIGRQAAQGLAYAHSRGVVHRDIKPSNLLLDSAGVVWITDFGLAKSEESGLTATGDVLGTIRYMAPERFRGESGATADIYALGLTLYELLTLRPAFDPCDRLKMIERIKTEEPARVRSLDGRIPRDLETIVLKATEKDPKERYASAEAMAEDLRRFLADEPIQARRASTAERYWRWARRNPGIAVLGGLLTLVLVFATVSSLLAARRFRFQAETQRALAQARESERLAAVLARAEEAAARRTADQSNAGLRAAQEELRQTVYATRSNLALAAWEAADVGRLRALLDLLRPNPGEPDLRGWEWRYLWQLAHEDRLTLLARKEDLFADVAFSPDKPFLASLERKGRIQLWDPVTGQSLRTMGVTTRGEDADLRQGVGALAYSPDGRTLAGPGPDASLQLYAVDSGRTIFRFEGPPGAVLDLAWSPDGRTLVAAISAHSMRVWDARDGHVIHKRFGGHNGPVNSVAFSPDGHTIASASFDRTVKLWNPEDPDNPRAVLKGHTDEVSAVAFSPDGLRVASGGLDRSIRVWDGRSGAELAVIWGHTGSVTSLAFLPDGARLVSGSTDQTVRIWDTASGQELRGFKGHTETVVAVAVSPDGRDIASASLDRALRVWAAASPPRPRTLKSPSVLTFGGGVECLAFRPDGRRLVSGHDDHALRVWELASSRPLLVIKGHTRSVKCVAYSPDGRTIASGGQDRSVRLWDAATGQPRLTYTGHADEIGGLVFTADGQTVLSGGYDRTIQAWDPATGVLRYVLRGHSDSVHALALCQDGRTLASASSDKTAILWDLATRQPRVTLRGHTDRIAAVAFSPDGRTVATSSDDTTVRLWDTTDGSPRSTLIGHIDDVEGLAFSPDGRLASTGRDKTIRLWDPASGQTMLILNGHAWPIMGVAYSPDGRTLASASHDRTLKLWEAAPAAALAADGESPVSTCQGDDRACKPAGIAVDLP